MTWLEIHYVTWLEIHYVTWLEIHYVTCLEIHYVNCLEIHCDLVGDPLTLMLAKLGILFQSFVKLINVKKHGFDFFN